MTLPAAFTQHSTAMQPAQGAGLATVAPATPAALAGASKAAIALVALGPEQAAEVLRHMPEDQAQQVSLEITQLGAISPELLETVTEELAEATSDEANLGGVSFTRDVLTRVVGEARAEDLIRQFLGGSVRPFDFMRTLSAEEAVQLLQGESVQTLALVIAHLPAATAGRVLDQLETSIQADVSFRLARLGVVDPSLLYAIDRGLREKHERGFGDHGEDEDGPRSGVEVLASILQGSGRATERQVLGALESVDAQLAAEVRERLFTFDDLPKLTDRDLQLVLRDIDAGDLVLALRGVSEELMDRVLSNMSQRAADSLREDLEMQPAKKRALVEEAQTKVVAAIRSLEEQGLVTLPGPSGSGGGDGGAEEDLL